jgi:hypothetical protein
MSDPKRISDSFAEAKPVPVSSPAKRSFVLKSFPEQPEGQIAEAED